MSGPEMTVGVQCAEGTCRVVARGSEPTSVLYERAAEALRLSGGSFTLHVDRARRRPLPSTKARTIRDVGLRHGDMLYLSPLNGTLLFDNTADIMEATGPREPADPKSPQPGPSAAAGSSRPPDTGLTSTSPNVSIEEDEVDLLLYQTSGAIQRQRDEKLCRHKLNGCCVHCSPLEPWDESYLKDHNIKHLSFHSYLRKITSGKFISLNEISCKIKPGCKEHPPWPRGICSWCQPGAVTLSRQPYRHVDNVLVEHPALVERFLGYWRATGHQRLGFLYGRWEPHPLVPLGIRARVAAIYEPAQESSRDHVSLRPDGKLAALAALAARLRLRRVGWLFTDLVPDDLSAGTVRHTRSAHTHLLTAQECITAAHYQNAHPNACRHAKDGYFGSKFVTVCVTGDAEKQVHLEGYQVSGQCAALERDGVVLPTRDAPDLGYIRPSGPHQYVPDVFYKENDAYGNEVGVLARTVPVAYMLVDVPCGVAPPSAPSPSAPSPAAATFPPEHRALQGHLQTLRALHEHVFSAPDFLEAVSDLHVLLYLATNEALPLSMEVLEPLLSAVTSGDARAAAAWRAAPSPATLEQLCRAAAGQEGAASGGAPPPAPPPDAGGHWTCQLCTFHNEAHRDACEMCAMPRSDAM